MRLIDADVLETHTYWECFENPDDDYEYVLKTDIDNAPTIEAESIVHCNECYFAEKYVMHGESRLFCNNEDALYRDVPLCGYCYCGAKMDEEDNQ